MAYWFFLLVLMIKWTAKNVFNFWVSYQLNASWIISVKIYFYILEIIWFFFLLEFIMLQFEVNDFFIVWLLLSLVNWDVAVQFKKKDISPFVVPASVIHVRKSTVVKEGENVTLVCNGSGLPTPSVTWLNAWNVTLSNETMWQLYNISRNVAGQYTCAASNACGSDSTKVDVNVQCESSFIISHFYYYL